MMRRPARPVFPGILRWLYLTAPVVVVILVLFTEARDSRPATRATRPAMGTSVTITVLHRSERRARMAGVVMIGCVSASIVSEKKRCRGCWSPSI